MSYAGRDRLAPPIPPRRECREKDRSFEGRIEWQSDPLPTGFLARARPFVMLKPSVRAEVADPIGG